MMTLDELKDYWKSEGLKPNSYFDCDWQDVEATGKQLMEIAHYMMTHDDDCDEDEMMGNIETLREDFDDLEECVKSLDYIEKYIRKHGRRKD